MLILKKLLFIINPKAGRTAIKNDLFEIIVTFSEAGYEVTTYPTMGPKDAERKIISDGAAYNLVVCAGGDGTMENIVNGYMKMGEKKVPIGYIPVGTTNDFARSLGISRKPMEAAKQIVNGERCLVDVGKFADDYFIYIAAFGMFTDISYNTKQSLKKLIGHSAYILEAIKNLANFRTYKIEAWFDEKLVTGEYIFGMVTNSFSVAGFKVRGSKHVLLNDGKFDCFLIKKPENVAEAQQILSAMLLNDIDEREKNGEVCELFFRAKASKVLIKCEDEIPWTIDGEFGGNKKEILIENCRESLGIVLHNNYTLGKNNGDDIEELDDEDEDSEDFEDYEDGWE